jgi:hypothetical protein
MALLLNLSFASVFYWEHISSNPFVYIMYISCLEMLFALCVHFLVTILKCKRVLIGAASIASLEYYSATVNHMRIQITVVRIYIETKFSWWFRFGIAIFDYFRCWFRYMDCVYGNMEKYNNLSSTICSASDT